MDYPTAPDPCVQDQREQYEYDRKALAWWKNAAEENPESDGARQNYEDSALAFEIRWRGKEPS